MGRVLVVDDNEKILKLMDMIGMRFKNEFELFIANSGKKALKILETTPIDLVITDLVMPEMDGFTLLAHINAKYPWILCIAMTGYATENVVNMLPDNLLQFIQKPFQIDALVATIKKSLKNKPSGGRVGGVSVAGFLHLIAMDERSCSLEVTLADNETGVFVFKEGVLFDAQLGALTGEAAAIEILIHSGKATFTFTPLTNPDIEKKISCSIMEILMKAALQRDEIRDEIISVEAENVNAKDISPAGGMGGVSIAAFLQLIQMDKKSCVVEAVMADNKKGAFLFRKGDLYDARFEELKGEAAAIEIMMHTGKTEFKLSAPPQSNISRKIHRPMTELLSEAARRRKKKGTVTD